MLQVVVTNTQGNFSSSQAFNVDTLEDYNALIKMAFNEATLNDRDRNIIADTREWLSPKPNPEHVGEAEAGEQGVEG
jgi:hypothetical protein